MFFFHAAIYNYKMSLSKLQKLYPSAIDKCAMVFVPPLACGKKKKYRRFSNTSAQFTNTRSIHCAFYQCRMIDDNQKRFIAHLVIETELLHSPFVNPFMM
jgi:hypothetical protein